MSASKRTAAVSSAEPSSATASASPTSATPDQATVGNASLLGMIPGASAAAEAASAWWYGEDAPAAGAGPAAEAAPAAPAQEDGGAQGGRRVEGAGGYVYQQFPDGTIVILEGGPSKILPPGDPMNEAITAEIGPFPAQVEPAVDAGPVAPETPVVTAPDEGGGVLGGIAAVAEAGLEAVSEVGSAAVGAVSDWWYGEEAPSEEEAPVGGSADLLPAPGETGETGETETGDVEQEDRFAYKDQRDNEFDETGVFEKKTERISADSMCNVTTLAMQLSALAADETELMSAAADVLIGAGYTAPKEKILEMQLEDVLMRIFKQLGDDYFVKLKLYTPNEDYGPHQYRNCLQHVAKLFTAYVGGSKDLDGGGGSKAAPTLEKDPETFYTTEVKPYADAGAAVMLSTKLTGGHIVMLVDVLGDGIVINDPYGIRNPGGYVCNGQDVNEKTKGRITGAGETYTTRMRENPTLKTSIDAAVQNGGKFASNLGERNFYPWAEVDQYAIGKWVSVLEAKE